MNVDCQGFRVNRGKNCCGAIDARGKMIKFVSTIPATLPIRTAHPGGFFYFTEVCYAVC
jgi:hypothetical protein